MSKENINNVLFHLQQVFWRFLSPILSMATDRFPSVYQCFKTAFFLAKFTLTSFLYAEHLRKTKYQHCSMTKSEGAYVYSRFDVKNTLHTCFQRLNATQISLWHQLWNILKSLQSSSNRCKEAFYQKEYFQVRLPLITMSSKLQLHTSN